MMRRSTTHGWTAVPLAVLGLLAALLALPTAAAAADVGTLSGTAYGTGGIGVEGVSVMASHRDAQGLWQGVLRSTTDAQGRWSMELPAGSYKVLFEDDRHGRYLNVHYGGADEFDEENATVVKVEAGLTTGGVDVQLQPAARVEGRVTSRAGWGIGAATVAALQRRETPTGLSWVVAQNGYTSPDGTFVVSNLEAGTYRLRFSKPGYLTEHYGGAEGVDDVAQAVDVVLDAGGQATADAVLDRGSSIAGSVTIPAGGRPLSGFVNVVALQDGRWETVASALVDDDIRTYYVAGLKEGTYKIAAGTFDQAYALRYHPLSASPEGGQPFVIADRQSAVTGVDFDLGVAPPGPADPPAVVPPGTAPPVAPVPPVATPAPPTEQSPPTDQSPPRFDRAPRLKGKATVGRRLRVLRVAVQPTTATLRYRWFADGKRIREASGPALRLSKALVGRRISLRLVAASPGGRTVVRLSAPGRVRAR